MLAALAAWSAPSVLGRDKEAAGAVARIEAIAGWTEMLRDTVSAAAGLEQAIAATAPLAPEAIRPQVTELAGRLASGARLDGALREFAAEVADPLADLVVAALIHAAAHHARRLGELLSSLAASARAQASMRLRVEAGRASLRTSVRMITTVTAVMAIGLVLLDRGYLAPYDSAGGQLVLLLVGVIFAAGFTLLRRMARHQQPARILAAAPPRPHRPAAQRRRMAGRRRYCGHAARNGGMSMPLWLALLLGTGLGAGAWLIISGAWPARPPLARMLAALYPRPWRRGSSPAMTAGGPPAPGGPPPGRCAPWACPRPRSAATWPCSAAAPTGTSRRKPPPP